MILVALVEAVRIAFLARLSDAQLVRNVPDDAFYYLQAARNFVRLGRWTFDGVEPSSGFHLLWGYLLAGIFFLHRSASLHQIFLISGALQCICLAFAAYLSTKTAERVAGTRAWPGVLLIFLSASSLLQGTWMMESPLVILCGGATLYLLVRVDSRLGLPTFLFAFLLGVLSSLCRSDAGLLALWLFLAHLYLYSRGSSNRRMLGLSVVLLIGAIAGVLLVSLNVHSISGHWAQASAQEKLFWSRVAGRSLRPAVYVLLSFFNPFTNAYNPFQPSVLNTKLAHLFALVIRFLWLLLITVGVMQMTRSAKGREVPFFSLAALATIVSYLFFYRYNSGALQNWYVSNFEAPLTLLTALAFAWLLGHWPRLIGGGLALMCASGIFFSFRPCAPWQEAMWRAGVYLHGHPDIRPLGAWNAGIVGYFADNGVINVDGLMNDSILGYSGTDTLIDYFTLRGIRYVFDAPQLWQPMMAARGGYSDGRLQACILKSVDMFPDDPDNTYVGGHIRLYTFSLACLSTASSELTHR